MDDNFFDPIPSPNLDPADPLREWATQLQDPELIRLMASDPQAAAEKMVKLGIPPPPPHILQYADGMGTDNNINAFTRGVKANGGVFGGDPALTPPTPDTSTPVRTNPNGTIAGNLSDDPNTPIPGARPGSILDKILRPTQASTGASGTWSPEPAVPVPTPDPRKSLASDLDPEVNPSAGLPLVPRARPAEAPPATTDVSASAKKKDDLGDALTGFSKSLSGIKPVPPAPPNFVGTPAVRSTHAIAAPNLQNLLSLVGQPQASPLALTLGRLLATGKA